MSVSIAYDARVSFAYPDGVTQQAKDALCRELFGWCDEMDNMSEPTVRIVTDDKTHADRCDKELQAIVMKYGGRVL